MTLKILLSTLTLISSLSTGDFAYENRVQMDENYLLQWSVKAPDIVFEMQVKTHGYMGFGLSRDGTVYGADIFISWMDDGHIFFYVSDFCSKFQWKMYKKIVKIHSEHLKNSQSLPKQTNKKSDSWFVYSKPAYGNRTILNQHWRNSPLKFVLKSLPLLISHESTLKSFTFLISAIINFPLSTRFHSE